MKLKLVSSKLVDILSSGDYKSVLFDFDHGLGDAIDFYSNVIPVLCKKFPGIFFAMKTYNGQDTLFGNWDRHLEDCLFDLEIRVWFSCAEWDATTDETKAELCIRDEFGLPPEKQAEKYRIPMAVANPLIGVHFFSTSSREVTCSEEIAHRLWNRIIERGLIPLDTHMQTPNGRNVYEPWLWEERTVNSISPNPAVLCGLMKSLGGFAGVSSGNFWAALTMIHPKKILYIETEFPVTKLTRLPVWSMKEYDEKIVDDWLDCCADTRNKYSKWV